MDDSDKVYLLKLYHVAVFFMQIAFIILFNQDNNTRKVSSSPLQRQRRFK